MTSQRDTVAIWWIRRDLRLADNLALQQALSAAPATLPLFIIDPVFERSSWVGEPRRQFLWSGLRTLDLELRARGGRLIVRHGKPSDVVTQLHQELDVAGIFAERDYSPYSVYRDAKIGEACNLTLTDGLTALPVGTILKDDGTPYTVFTPFRNRWRENYVGASVPVSPPPKAIRTPAGIESDNLPPGDGDNIALWPASPSEAHARLRTFLRGPDSPPGESHANAPIYRYKTDRDRPDLHGTSQLSPYFRFGPLSAARACRAAYQAIESAPTGIAAKGANAWLDELIWREFYVNILHHFPHVRAGSFRPEYDRIQWRNDADEFQAWCEGRTGYPFIDAAMRQLQKTGWMHNRSRMVVASFLVKDLLIDWRWGEKWFMQNLVDGDPASNNGGWQWTAGTGTDAAPYFRIFNPITQSSKFDPTGTFIRRWLPELGSVPDAQIHEPWKMSVQQQKQAHCRIGTDYPAPIVDHAFARDRTLEAYQVARGD